MYEPIPDFTANEFATGVYVCTNCGTPLFEESKKFDARCGFPSFWQHIGDHVKHNPLHTHGKERIQLLCKSCEQHLGHLFAARHTPSGIRYCIAKEALVRK